MRKRDNQEQLNRQRAIAAVLYDTYSVPLTTLHDLTWHGSLGSKASREERTYASNILAAIFAIAHGHPEFVPYSGHGGHGSYLGRAFFRDRYSPADALGLLTDLQGGIFEDLVRVCDREYPQYGLLQLVELKKFVPKWLKNYIQPDLQYYQMIRAENIICFQTFKRAYLDDKNKGFLGFGILSFIAENGLGRLKKATQTTMSELIEKREIYTLEDVKKHRSTDPLKSRTPKILKSIGADSGRLYFNMGIDIKDFDNLSSERARKIIEILQTDASLVKVLAVLVLEYATAVPDMNEIKPAINFS